MRLATLVVRGFRNLADAEWEVPAAGAVLLGDNGQGKTSLLEAVAYPVLFRSFRTRQDADLIRYGAAGFALELAFGTQGQQTRVRAEFRAAGRRRSQEVNGVATPRLTEAAGAWLAVSFLPSDVRLASGPASDRRLYLDRTLALANRGYLRALVAYRAALRQRNAALRQRRADLAAAFDPALAEAGARVVSGRLNWVARYHEQFRRELASLGETSEECQLAYRGNTELADPAAWPAALAAARSRDEGRGMTTAGPHRDDLELRLAGRALREFGSTGQQRTAAVGLKLLELRTIEEAAGESPALLLDDVFAELDQERQSRLARRLFESGRAQVFLTSPRLDELPDDLGLPVWRVAGGRVRRDGEGS